jgi:hypothetical protein
MKRIMNYTFFIIALFLVSSSGYSQGWIITEADNSLTFISDEWVKAYESDMDEVPITSMYKPGSNLIIMINENDMVYAKGTIEDFCNAMKSIQEEMNKQLPAEQQKMMEQMIADEKAKPAPKVTVQKSGGESIAGYNTTKYSITVDGELFEEKWISNDASLKSLTQVMNATVDMTLKTVSCSVPDESFLKNAPEFSKEYMDVERAGIELRSIRYEYGSAEPETEVISIEKEDLSSDEFEVPEDYSEVSMKELIMSMSGM